jgi:DNA mismatch repair protein MutH
MNYEFEYDKTNPSSIEAYAQKLIGKTFSDICDEDDRRDSYILRETPEYNVKHENKKRKGGLGEIVEERFFHYAANNDSRPDFPEAGVELKVTPYKKNKNGTFSAKERLIITMIDYFQVVEETFEESHVWMKSRLILLVYYLYEQEIKNRLDYTINYARLFSPPEQDIKVIKQDYEVIINKIKEGKAHELSESDTMYLGAATKSSSSKNRRKQPFSDIEAKPRAFSFKSSYMTYVLNNYIMNGKTTYEPIIKADVVDSFEDYVTSKINGYRGLSIEELCKKFEITYDKIPKNLEAVLAYRILGIKGNHAEEFVKANIVVKAIRIEENGTIKQNMSFPTFKFKELVEEEWEDSTFGNYLRNTRFLFVIYRYENGGLFLKGCQFWNIPYEDLERDVKSVWQRTKQVLVEGLQFEEVNGKYRNNFPKASENRVCHVRPHGRNKMDTYELPDGRQYPKQCFWLDRRYILQQIKEEILS